jgi:signal transduction histidine kinase/CheY-like chemotaxis protein
MNFEDKLVLLANMAKEVIEADRCSIWSYNPEKNEFITKVAHGVDPLTLPTADGIVGHCFLTNETIIIDDVYTSEYFEPSIDEETGYRSKSVLTMPIVNNKNEAIGVFQALNKISKDEKFTQEDKNLLELMTAYVSEVLESTHLYEKLQEKNRELEGLNNNLESIIKERTGELQEEKQKAQKANIAKSEFLANMSHEIRTPLNAIFGLISILKEKENDKEKIEYLKVIDNNSMNLLHIINEILDFSKIENNKISIEMVSFDLKDKLSETVNLFSSSAEEKNIKLFLNINENLPLYVKSDLFRIKQIIINLLSNSIKFTPEGKNIYVDISYKAPKLLINIKDEGIGIQEDKIEYIFDPFEQVDSSTTRKYGGTGLGLAICKKLVELLGGDLGVKSKVGVGSEFYFSIPIKVEKSSDIDSKKLMNKDKFQGYILLVEDNKSNQMFMKVLLKKLGLTVDIANDGVEAIEKFKKDKYDLILMDENMPNLSGIEATKEILTFEKENSLVHTPIIALTANALKGDRERFLSVGMDEYLSKPLDKDLLNIALNRFLDD